MRVLGVSAALALSLVLGGTTAIGLASTAAADGQDAPTKQEVRDARSAASAAADDVAGVQAQLAVANQRLQESSIRAAQAAEAHNGARWEARQARKAAAQARQRAERADDDLALQRDAYADTIADSYELAPGLTALAAVVQAHGIETVIDRTTTLGNAERALDQQYDDFRASSTLAEVARSQAESASAAAEKARRDALAAQQTAQRAAGVAAAEAAAIADQRAALVDRLAELQGVSVLLAQQRQAALERRAARAAARAARIEAAAEIEAEQQQAAEDDAAQEQDEPADQPADTEEQSSQPTDEPAAPAPASDPAPTSGAAAAIAFARAQLGEPYRWGAAGPGSWDCSGLTAGAWAAGGKSLPHYSVAQYQQSTPIRANQLQPGDLVFWGSSGDAGSIYHVALYVGGGKIIHAPRTGRPVTEESMYYWIPPNFYARP